MSTILVTGGTGFIGSHTVIELVKSGFTVILLDCLSNSKQEVLRRLEKITGTAFKFYQMDIMSDELPRVFAENKIDCVMHFAALKAVGESCSKPLEYYTNNVAGTLKLLKAMRAANVHNFIFSSSATVYGTPQYLPLDEKHPTGVGITNPYGSTKHMVEQILIDLAKAEPTWNIVLLRYFNPVGAHESGLIGEDPQQTPNNLMPYIAWVAVGRLPKLTVFGSDYDTPDGTGVRDYIHVVDLAVGHVAALKRITDKCGLEIYNLGTGCGYSVLDMVKAFESASGKPIPYQMADRRPGDVASCYACPEKASATLGWSATRGIDQMCKDLWNFQQNNPRGVQAEDK